jgi:hypothetical protein
MWLSRLTTLIQKLNTDVTHMVTQYKKVNIEDHCNMGVQLVSERCPREDL